MRGNRLLLGLSAALIMGLVVSLLVYHEFSKLSAIRPTSPVHVVVAAVPLTLGSRLAPAQLRLIPWPSEAPMPGMFTRIEDCTGRAVMTDVNQNEPILESKLAPLQAGAGLSVAIPEGMRAVSVPVNEVVGVAGFVVPGTIVDVLVTGSVSNGVKATKTILEGARVMAAGQRIEQDKDGKPQSSTVVTLLVSPQDADRLSMAGVQGRIQLALRNTLDVRKVDPPAILEASLYGYSQPIPVRMVKAAVRPVVPPPPVVVEVIYGNKRETKTFPSK